ncbi:hypothetical protein BH11ACT4_BH11ACT4_05080 [soil metagenome]
MFVSVLQPVSAGAVVSLWFGDGHPVSLEHAGRHYRVTDQPTRLEDEEPDLAYRLGLSGWRLQGTDDAGLSHMFDLRRNGDTWHLIRMYD